LHPLERGKWIVRSRIEEIEELKAEKKNKEWGA